MGREKDRKLNRRRRRLTKLRKLKVRLAQTRDLKERQDLMRRISKTSMRPQVDNAKE
ncbi:MAG: hypothetical protein MUO62_00820 [Anaerolineales bacterium]|nr:hypothetical protein [Anaerolineales bacterium]